MGTALPGVTLTVRDRDLVLGDWHDFLVSGSEHAHLLCADNASGLVLVNGEMRVPKNAASRQIDIKVQVYDSHAASAATQTDIIITVTDVNDHQPVFEPKSYSGSVSGRS